MSSKRPMQPLIILVLTLFSFTIIVKSSQAWGPERIAVYWGQNNGDGDLSTTCDSGNYKTVILSFLNKFGSGREVGWNFDGHCGRPGVPCSILEEQINHCQDKGVHVFLSIGGAIGDYSLSSKEDAKVVAKYLFDNFLTHNPRHDRPLGKVVLDGIDFAIRGGEDQPERYNYWEDLAEELDFYRRPYNQFALSASPECVIPDKHLQKAINTTLFNYIFVHFYNHGQCEYSQAAGTAKLLKSWDEWINSVGIFNTVLLGLPASPVLDAFGLSSNSPFEGFIPAKVMIDKVFPHIKNVSRGKYGGVALWDRHFDLESGYSSQIKPYVPTPPPSQPPAGAGGEVVSNVIYQCVSDALNNAFPNFIA